MELAVLRDNLVTCFNRGEMRNLCFDLGFNHEVLEDGSQTDQARELIEYCRRRGLLNELVQRCRQLRPHVEWESLYSDQTHRHLRFEWASDIVVNRKRLAEAVTIDWMAISSYKTIQIYKDEIETCLKGNHKGRGGHVRLLLVEPESEIPLILAQLGHKFGEANIIKDDIYRTLRQVVQWRQLIPGCKVEARFILGQPPYRIMLVNRNLDTGYIRLRWVTTPSAKDVPTVVLTRNRDLGLLDFYTFLVDQYDEYWNKAWEPSIEELLEKRGSTKE